MMADPATKDLIVLSADKSMKLAFEAILKRHQAIEIREISFHVIVQPTYDSGVLRSGALLLQSQSRNFRYAIAVCDRHGCGQEQRSRQDLEATIEQQLAIHWFDRSAAIVIDPELEQWFWAKSPHVPKVIAWPEDLQHLQSWLLEQGLWPEGAAKPPAPKEALEAALYQVRKQKSSALFSKLGDVVSLQRCADPAFQKLISTLKGWFPMAR